MPPSETDRKKPEPVDSLLGDFDFGDEEFNWDQLADVAGGKLDSENELPPELRGAVVRSSTETETHTLNRTETPTSAAVSPVSAEVAATVDGPLDLPPIDGEPAPLPPLVSTPPLLGEFDLDFPVVPSQGQNALESVSAKAQSSGEQRAAVVADQPQTATQTTVHEGESDDDEYDVQIDAVPGETKSLPVADPSISQLLPDFGRLPTAGVLPNESSVEFSLPPPPTLPAEKVTPSVAAQAAVAGVETVLPLPVHLDGKSSDKPSGETTAELAVEPLPPPPPSVATPSLSPSADKTPEAAPVALPTAVAPVAPETIRYAPQPLRNQGPAIVARRLPLPSTEHLPPPPVCASSGAATETAVRKVLLSLFTVEAQHKAHDRSADLHLAAALCADSLHETSVAIEHYRRVLDINPNHRAALRALRRLFQTPGPSAQPDEAASFIEREQEHSNAQERLGLHFQHIELLRASGQLGETKRQAQSFLDATPRGVSRTGQAWAHLTVCGMHFAQGKPSDIAPSLDGLASLQTVPGPLSAAFLNHRARLDETCGRDPSAAQRFETVFGHSPTLTAALGRLRVAARLPRASKAEASPVAKVAQAVLGSKMAASVRAALLRLVARHSPTASQRSLFEAAAEQGDDLSWEDVAVFAERAGDFPSAAAAHTRSAQNTRDGVKRAEALRLAGRAHVVAGQHEAAQHALVESLSSVANANSSQDGVTQRLLERVCRKLGRPEDLLKLWRKQAETGDGQGVYALLYAAELQLQTAPGPAGIAAAQAELETALQLLPDFEEAAHRLAILLAQAGKPVDSAQVLMHATRWPKADPASELCRRVLREDAALQLSRVADYAGAVQALLHEPPPSTALLELAPSLQQANSRRLWSLATRLRGVAKPELLQQLSDALHQTAALATASLAARLWFTRGCLAATLQAEPCPEGGVVEESHRQALLARPHDARALLRLEFCAAQTPTNKLLHSPLAHMVTDALAARLDLARGTPSHLKWGIRLAVAQEIDAGAPSIALRTYRELVAHKDSPVYLPGLGDWMFSTAWRAGEGLAVLENELSQDPDSDTRYALLMLSGEQLEAAGQPRQAVERYQQALELKPAHPVAKARLVQAHLLGGTLDELARFTLAEIKEATDIATRVQAFERQALLANLRLADPALRSAALEEAHRNVLTVDASNHLAMRALERHFVAHGQLGELVHLYEQMGLTATDTPFAVHISLDRARLRQRLFWQHGGDLEATHNQMENDFRLALYRDRSCRPALRFLYEAAVQRADYAQIAELAQWIGVLPVASGPSEESHKQSAAIFLTRAAEATAQIGGDPDQVVGLYQAALERTPGFFPTLRGLLHFALLHKHFAVALDCAEKLADEFCDLEQKYLHYMLAGVLAQHMVPDAARARRALRKGLQLLPDRKEAFDRLRVSLAASSMTNTDDARALVDLLKERLARGDINTEEEANIRVELGQLYAGPLKNRAMAKHELGQALRLKPNQPAALFTLGKLHADDGEWQHAIDPLKRYGELETRPSQLLAVHLLLGEVFGDKLQDPHQAISAYTQVVKLQPTNQVALTKLADLFLAQNRSAETLPLLKRLVKYTEDKQRKIGYLHRIAGLAELQGDARGALDALRQAVEVDSTDLSVIRELALYYERTSDSISLRFHLDAAAGRFRAQLVAKPRELSIYQTLLQIFALRKNEQAHFAAGAVLALGGVVPKDMQTRLEKLPPRKEPKREALRDPTLDDALFPPLVSPTIRAMFKLLAEPFAKLYVSDGRKLLALGVDRKEKLPRQGHPIRDLANKIAADLGVPEFDVYLTAATGKNSAGQAVPHYTIESLEPPALILSKSLVDGASEAEQRFLLAGLLKILHSQLHLPLRLSSEDLAVLFGGLIRQQVKDYAPVGFAEKRIEAEATRQRRAFPSKLAPQIAPLALEFHASTPNYEGMADALTLSSHTFGLFYCGSVQAAVSALRRKGPLAEPQIDALLTFAVGREANDLLGLFSGGT